MNNEDYTRDNGKQIKAIIEFAKILTYKYGRVVGFEEAAMVWVKESHAAEYRHECV